MAKVYPEPHPGTVATTTNTPNAAAGAGAGQPPSPLILSNHRVAALYLVPEDPKISKEQSIELQNLNARNALSQSDRKNFLEALHKIFKIENKFPLQICARAHKDMPKIDSIQDDLINNYLSIRKQFSTLILVTIQCLNMESVKQYLKLPEDIVNFTDQDLADFNTALAISINASLEELKNYANTTQKTRKLARLEASQAVFTQDSDTSQIKEIKTLKETLAQDRVYKIVNSGLDVLPTPPPPSKLDKFDNTVIALQAKHRKGCCSLM